MITHFNLADSFQHTLKLSLDSEISQQVTNYLSFRLWDQKKDSKSLFYSYFQATALKILLKDMTVSILINSIIREIKLENIYLREYISYNAIYWDDFNGE